jgi:hypothetical protein
MRDRQMWRKCETEISDLKRDNTQNAVCMETCFWNYFLNPIFLTQSCASLYPGDLS